MITLKSITILITFLLLIAPKVEAQTRKVNNDDRFNGLKIVIECRCLQILLQDSLQVIDFSRINYRGRYRSDVSVGKIWDGMQYKPGASQPVEEFLKTELTLLSTKALAGSDLAIFLQCKMIAGDEKKIRKLMLKLKEYEE